MTTRIEAPAKLTWSLRITGVRNDGFHLIDAEMTSLALADIVTLDRTDQNSLEADGPFAEGVPLDSSNLIWRAADLIDQCVRARITKNIPHGGGLGGGSTDAAAILRWAQMTDLETASRIGADVAFCMVGGRARVTGIGEIVEQLPHIDRDVTLIVPPIHVSTPRVYARWDKLGGPTGDNGNDLEPAALAEVPDLMWWRDRIADAVGIRPRLAGSGATWFLEGHHDSLISVLSDAPVVLTSARADAGSIQQVD